MSKGRATVRSARSSLSLSFPARTEQAAWIAAGRPTVEGTRYSNRDAPIVLSDNDSQPASAPTPTSVRDAHRCTRHVNPPCQLPASSNAEGARPAGEARGSVAYLRAGPAGHLVGCSSRWRYNCRDSCDCESLPSPSSRANSVGAEHGSRASSVGAVAGSVASSRSGQAQDIVMPRHLPLVCPEERAGVLWAIANESDECYDSSSKNKHTWTAPGGRAWSRACRGCEEAGVPCMAGKGIVYGRCSKGNHRCGAGGKCEASQTLD